MWVLDKTKTAMGARLLRNYIEQPLIEKDEMEKRLDAIQELNQDSISRDEIREYLNPVYDLERLLSKVTYKTANPRDLIAFRNSLQMLPPIKTVLSAFEKEELTEIREQIDGLEDIYQLIDEAIIDEPPMSIREGGMIKDQFDETIDRLRSAKHDGKQWLAQLEEEDRERTGIKNLKIKYNKVFGYYFEVTNSYKDLVPEDYIRKQTLANAERYTTPRLKELEDTDLKCGGQATDTGIRCVLQNPGYHRTGTGTHPEHCQGDRKAGCVCVPCPWCRSGIIMYVPKLNEKGVIDIKDGQTPCGGTDDHQ